MDSNDLESSSGRVTRRRDSGSLSPPIHPTSSTTISTRKKQGPLRRRGSSIDSSGIDSGKDDVDNNVAAANNDSGDLLPSTTRKKRGRPPKKTPKNNDDDVDIEGDDDIIIDTENIDNELNSDTDVQEEEKVVNKPKPLVLLGDKPRGLHECDYCGSDLTRTPRIRCAVCPDFDLCMECFATSDHEHMSKYKRAEEAQRRKDAARLTGVELEEEVVEQKPKKGRGRSKGRGRKGSNNSPTPASSSNSGNTKDEEHAELGSYIGGIWVPYFRHEPHHGYIVADSTRYNMFPSFRGVKEVDTFEILDSDNDGGKKKKTKKNEDDKESAATKQENPAVGSSVFPEENVVKPLEEDEKSTLDQAKYSAVMDIDEKVAGNGGDSTENPPSASALKTDSKPMDVDGAVAAVDENNSEKQAGETEAQAKVNEMESATKSEADASDDAMQVESSLSTSEAKVEQENEDIKDESKGTGDDEPLTLPSDKPTAIASSGNASIKKQTEPPSRFRVIDDPKSMWTAEEDLRLLSGILTCGLGNWPEIAEHINGADPGSEVTGANGEGGSSNGKAGKTDKQCMERYLDDFMGRYGYILPPYTLVPEPEGECEEDNKKDEDSKPAAADTAAAPSATESLDGENVEAGIARKRPRRSLSSNVIEENDTAPGFKRTKFRVVPTDELEESQNLWPHPYIPKTGVKYGDEVARDLWYRSEQQFIRQITGAPSKADADAIRTQFIERRAQNLAGYEAKVLPPRLEDCKKLPGSELAGYMPRRGDFDMEWGNEAEKTIAEMEFTSEDTKADRELKLDVIRIFNEKLDERAKRKQFIIDQGLLNYRENQEKMWRMAPDERHLVQRMRLFARYQTKEEHMAFVNKIIEAKRLRKEIAKLQMHRRLGITSLVEAEKYELDKSRREEHIGAWIKKEEEKKKAAEDAIRAAREDATSLGIAPPPPVQPVSEAGANQSLQVWKQFKTTKKESSTNANKFVIKDKPGYDLLSSKEVSLCKRLHLLPQDYLDVKKALISESLAQGIYKPSVGSGQKKSMIFKVDVTQRDNVIDFVLEAGWISSRPKV